MSTAFSPLLILLFLPALLLAQEIDPPPKEPAEPPLGKEVFLPIPEGKLSGFLLPVKDANPDGKIVLIHPGSGPTDRDGNSQGFGKNNSLRLLAEGLAEQGIPSLRIDKRGLTAACRIAEKDLRFGHMVEDVIRWSDVLREKEYKQIILVGHSEGSLVTLLAAEKAKAHAWVCIAGPGRPAGAVLREQLRGAPRDLQKTSHNILTQLEAGKPVDDVPKSLHVLFRPSVQPYLISWLEHDPAKAAADLKIPALVVHGTTDLQVTKADADILHKATKSIKGSDLKVIPKMNHVLKHVVGPKILQLPSYGLPDLPLHDDLVPAIVGFLK